MRGRGRRAGERDLGREQHHKHGAIQRERFRAAVPHDLLGGRFAGRREQHPQPQLAFEQQQPEQQQPEQHSLAAAEPRAHVPGRRHGARRGDPLFLRRAAPGLLLVLRVVRVEKAQARPQGRVPGAQDDKGHDYRPGADLRPRARV